MGLIKPIPPKLREELNADPFMHKCGLTHRINPSWHHAFEYAGKRINERWAIFPLSQSRHDRQSNFKSVHNDHTLKEFVQWRCLCRMTKEELEQAQKCYSHVNWAKRFEDLHHKYAFFDIDTYLQLC